MPPRFFYRFFPSDGRPADTDFAARFFVPTGLRNHAPPSFFHCFGDPRFAIMRPIPLLFDERFISVPFHYDFHHPVRSASGGADTTRYFPGCWNWSRSTPDRDRARPLPPKHDGPGVVRQDHFRAE